MNKIIFKGIDKEFDVITVFGKEQDYIEAAHEIITNSDRAVMEIHFPSTIEYSDIVAVYNNEDALSEITIIDDTTNETYVYLNYVIPISLSLKRYGTKAEVAMFGPDRWIMTIAQLNDADKQFRKLIGIAAKSVSCLTLDEYKDAKIQVSKENLEKYLRDHPLISNCKDGVYKEYTVTTEKQNQFAAQFAVYLANKMAGVEDVFTWNEKGKPCIPWDEPACIKWMNATKAYTKPLVTAQQNYEVTILGMTSKTDVEKYEIDYSTVETVNGKPSWIDHTDAEIDAAEKVQANLPNETALA